MVGEGKKNNLSYKLLLRQLHENASFKNLAFEENLEP